jgi:hypothetical protein
LKEFLIQLLSRIEKKIRSQIEGNPLGIYIPTGGGVTSMILQGDGWSNRLPTAQGKEDIHIVHVGDWWVGDVV